MSEQNIWRIRGDVPKSTATIRTPHRGAIDEVAALHGGEARPLDGGRWEITLVRPTDEELVPVFTDIKRIFAKWGECPADLDWTDANQH